MTVENFGKLILEQSDTSVAIFNPFGFREDYGGKDGLPLVVVARTNSMIACFAGPSFHDGRTPARPCAFAAVATTSSDRAGNAAAVDSRTRRLIREEGRVGFMFGSFGNGVRLWPFVLVSTPPETLPYGRRRT
jgi:hypothetical protein